MKKDFVKKFLIFTFGIIVLSSLIGTLVFVFPQKTSTNKPVQKAIDYINQLIAPQGQKAELVSWEPVSGLYKITFKIEGREYQSFVTRDGRFLFPVGYDLNQKISPPTQAVQKSPEKRERPDVKLFVMSYCPFGVQMEKALLPVWELLKEKAEIGIYFVNYIMHGKEEMEENLRQYCIQKEEKEKFLVYLNCFTQKGKTEECLKEAKIDEEKLKSCQETTDKEFKISENFKEEGYPPFNIHKDLCEKYGVEGSPTLVVNDTVINVERSPEKVKQAICNAFLNPPPECEQKLSEEQASIGFGTGQGGGGGQCK